MSESNLQNNTAESAITASRIAQADEIERQQKIAQVSANMDMKADYLNRIVHKNANPNPGVIVGSVLVVIGVLYLIYIFGFKPNASGEWYDDQNTQWILEHDAWSDQVSLLVNGKRVGRGIISDNMFKFQSKIGIWNYNDVILFVGGGNITRVRQ